MTDLSDVSQLPKLLKAFGSASTLREFLDLARDWRRPKGGRGMAEQPEGPTPDPQPPQSTVQPPVYMIGNGDGSSQTTQPQKSLFQTLLPYALAAAMGGGGVWFMLAKKAITNLPPPTMNRQDSLLQYLEDQGAHVKNP